MSANKDLFNQSFSGRFFRSCVWMWELGHKESWVPKNWCFWTVVLDKTLESSLNSRRSNLPSYRRAVLNIPSTEYSQLMVMLKLQYFGHPMQRIDSLEKTLLLGNSKSRRKSGWKVMRFLYGITNSMDVSLTKPGSWWRTTSGKPGVLQSILSQRVGHNWATELHWTEAFWPVRALEQESKDAVTGSDHKAPACLHAWLWVLGQADPFASTAN